MSKPMLEEIFNYRSGRRNRKSYAKAFALMVLLSLCFSAFNIGLGASGVSPVAQGVLLLICLPVTFALIIGQLSISAQRFRDLGKSGWFVLLMFIPIASIFIQLILLIAPGQKGPNKFGDDPLDRKVALEK